MAHPLVLSGAAQQPWVAAVAVAVTLSSIPGSGGARHWSIGGKAGRPGSAAGRPGRLAKQAQRSDSTRALYEGVYGYSLSGRTKSQAGSS